MLFLSFRSHIFLHMSTCKIKALEILWGAWMQSHKDASWHTEKQRPCCCFSLESAVRRNPETAAPRKQEGKYLYCTVVIIFLFGKDEKRDRQSKVVCLTWCNFSFSKREMVSSTWLGWYGKFPTKEKCDSCFASISPCSEWIIVKRKKRKSKMVLYNNIAGFRETICK